MTRSFFLLSLFAVGVFAQEPDGAPGRILARPKADSDPSATHTAIVGAGARIDQNLHGLNILVIHVPEARRIAVILKLSRTGLFEFVESDAFGTSTAVVPNDSFLASQPWSLKSKFQSPADSLGAWDLTTGSAAIQIAVIDSGCDGTHPDLAGKCIAGYDVLTATPIAPGAQSDNGGATGHGTAISGIVGAATNNAKGIAGAAWLSPVMPIVARQPGIGIMYWSDLAAGLVWAADHGALIANMSVAGPDSSTLEAGLLYAYQRNVVLFGSAGNDGTSACAYPACSPYVISVGAVDGADAKCSFSNFGSSVTLYAAGCLSTVYTTQMGGTYGYWQGTSVAAPIVAGAAALMLAVQPGLKPSDIKSILLNNSDQIADGIRLNARKAVAAAIAFSGQPPPPPPPPPTDTTPPTIAITYPHAGAVGLYGPQSIFAKVGDNVGLAQVIMYVDNVQFCLKPVSGTSISTNCSWNANKATLGKHILTARAMDLAGNSTMSDPVSVSATPR